MEQTDDPDSSLAAQVRLSALLCLQVHSASQLLITPSSGASTSILMLLCCAGPEQDKRQVTAWSLELAPGLAQQPGRPKALCCGSDALGCLTQGQPNPTCHTSALWSISCVVPKRP